MEKYSFTVNNPNGLYATPINNIVNSVSSFTSNLSLTYGNRTVNLKSMMGVMSLGIPNKAAVEIVAEGPDEERAIKEIKRILADEEIIQQVLEGKSQWFVFFIAEEKQVRRTYFGSLNDDFIAQIRLKTG